MIDSLKAVSCLKTQSYFRTNTAVLDELSSDDRSQRFAMVDDDESLKNANETLLHLETTPPRVEKHLPSLRYKISPKIMQLGTGRNWVRASIDPLLLARS